LAFARRKPMNRYPAKIISVGYKDLLFDVYLGFHVSITICARLYGIEIFAERAMLVIQFIEDWFDKHKSVVIEYNWFGGDQDMRGVWAVTVIDPVLTETLNEALVNQGLAKLVK
jgi:hypothetical protein